MYPRTASLFLILAGIMQTGLAVAQGTPPQVRFESAVAQVGELIPDLTVVDDQGNPVNLRDITRGHYTTITLGCLT
jgi:cytochrome oxidase Cu insertion factor (SCO1/SenC/PrrC family)